MPNPSFLAAKKIFFQQIASWLVLNSLLNNYATHKQVQAQFLKLSRNIKILPLLHLLILLRQDIFKGLPLCTAHQLAEVRMREPAQSIHVGGWKRAGSSGHVTSKRSSSESNMKLSSLRKSIALTTRSRFARRYYRSNHVGKNPSGLYPLHITVDL